MLVKTLEGLLLVLVAQNVRSGMLVRGCVQGLWLLRPPAGDSTLLLNYFERVQPPPGRMG